MANLNIMFLLKRLILNSKQFATPTPTIRFQIFWTDAREAWQETIEEMKKMGRMVNYFIYQHLLIRNHLIFFIVQVLNQIRNTDLDKNGLIMFTITPIESVMEGNFKNTCM